jgi:alkylhydroperoxidase/carboxymuconolactone decarboxylase family protein YurZ
MTRIPIVRLDTASPAAKTLLAHIRERALTPDSLLNLHPQMAYSPTVLASYLGVRRALEEFGTLDFKTRSAIMLTVSALDGATYAAAVNSVLVARAGWAPDEIARIRSGTFDADQRLARLLNVVSQAARHVGRVDVDAWQAALSAGWTIAELAEAFTSVALTMMVDHFVHFAETPLDVPNAPFHEPALPKAS